MLIGFVCFWVFFLQRSSQIPVTPLALADVISEHSPGQRHAAHSGAPIYTHMAPDLHGSSLQLPNLPYWTDTYNVHSRDLITWKLSSVFCSKGLLKTVWKFLHVGLFISLFFPGTNCLTCVVFSFRGYNIVLMFTVTLESLWMRSSGLPCGNVLLHQSCCSSSKPSHLQRRFLWVGDITQKHTLTFLQVLSHFSLI